MKQIRYLISVILILSLLLGAMPVSALAETLQELTIEEAMQDGVPANAEGDLPDETTGDEAPMQEIFLIEEETAEPQLSLNDLPQMMEDIQAALSETVSEEEDILEETIETETESAPMDMVLAPLLIEEAQPISLDSVEYIIGEESADLALNLPAEALPVTEIEGLVCDADYFHAEGTLTLASAWLHAQDAEEIVLTIYGADGNTYLQPILLVNPGETEIQPLFTGEYDVSNLFVDGISVAEGSGEDWNYADGILTIDITNPFHMPRLRGSGSLYQIQVNFHIEDGMLCMENVNLFCAADIAILGRSTKLSHVEADIIFAEECSIAGSEYLFYGDAISVEFVGGGTLSGSSIYAYECRFNGPTLNLVSVETNSQKSVYLEKGVLNLSGNDEFAIKGNVCVYAVEQSTVLNINKVGDGLDFCAIQGYIGDYRYSSKGKAQVNITLSGASNFMGIHQSLRSANPLDTADVNIRIDGANHATGFYNTDRGYYEEATKKIKIEITNTKHTAVGYKQDGNTINNIEEWIIDIDGAEKAIGIDAGNSDLTIKNGQINMKIQNTSDETVGVYAKAIQLENSDLDVLADPANKNSVSVILPAEGRLCVTGGNVQLHAASLAAQYNYIATDSKEYKLVGSRLSCIDGVVSMEKRPEIIINGEAHYVYTGCGSISGDGWVYDCDTCTLSLNDFHGDSIRIENVLDQFTVHVSGENSLRQIYTPNTVYTSISGSGKLIMEGTGSNLGIEAGEKLTISGAEISLKGYDYGLCSVESIELSACSISASDCHIAFVTTDMNIAADVSMNLQTMSQAIKCRGKCILAGAETEIASMNELVIEDGSIVSSTVYAGLQINDIKIITDDLRQDHSGSGWRWIAAKQQLQLDGGANISVAAYVDFISVHVCESVENVSISANHLTLSSEDGVWVTDVNIYAENLAVQSGTWMLSKDVSAALDLKELLISGGSLSTGGDIVAEKLTISGGKLKSGTLAADDLKISGGSMNVTSSKLYAEEVGEKIFYGLVAVECNLSGGNILTAEPAFFGNYTQNGGSARFAENAGNSTATHSLAVGASEAFIATGGRLEVHNGFGVALFATTLNLGGKLNADIYGEGGLFFANSAMIAGKSVAAGKHTTLVMSKGKTETLSREKYYGLVVCGQGFGKHMVKTASLSGDGWSWDHDAKKLTISSELQGKMDQDIYIDCGSVTLYLQSGGVKRTGNKLDILSMGALTITGDGSFRSLRISSPKAIKIKGCRNISAVSIYTNSSLTLDDVQGNLHYEAVGNVSINNSRLHCYDDCANNKNLTIKNSYIYYDAVYSMGKSSINNSIMLVNEIFYSKNGKSIAKNAAVFLGDVSDNGIVYFKLQKDATLGRDWLVNNDYRIVVPNKRTLTISAGKTLYIREGYLTTIGSGKIKGTVSTVDAAEKVEVSGPDLLTIGGSIQLNAAITPEKTLYGLKWVSSDPGLCEVDANGRLTATRDAARVGEKVTITVCYEKNSNVFATHEIQLIPAAEEIAARDASGRYAKDIVLSLDPAQKTAQLTAKVYPFDAPQAVTWKSSDSKIVSVDENGVITAKKAGSANVYAVAADGSGVQSQNVKVTVKKAPTSIKFTTTKPVLGYDPEIGTGSTYQLKVKLSSGSASTVKYTSANEGIAVVDANGIVTAKGAGKVKVTAQTYNGKKASCTVEVKTAPQSISISPKQLTIGVGMKHSFTASIPKNSFGSWYFSTSNACGGIDAATGEFVALKPGEVDVIATTFNGRSDSCTVQVLPAPEELKLNQPQLKMGLNEKFTLQVEASLKDGSPAMGSYTYASSDKKVATVSSTGKITAKKRGTAIITVTANGGASAQCEVIVEKAPSKVSLKVKKVTLVYDEAMQAGTDFLNPASLPSGTSSALTYKSSNQKVAVVDEEGRITAKGVGTAKITVKTFNGKSATCTVTVKAAPKELKFDQEIYTISVDQKLYAKITNASGLDLTRYGGIISLDPKAEILTVDAQGASFAGREVGSAQLKAAAFNAAEGYAEVRILPPPDALALEKTTLTLKKGKKYTVKAQLSREDGQETTAGLSLVSGNSKIAGVSGMTITAKAKGKTVITVQTHNGLSQEIQLKVN